MLLLPLTLLHSLLQLFSRLLRLLRQVGLLLLVAEAVSEGRLLLLHSRIKGGRACGLPLQIG